MKIRTQAGIIVASVTVVPLIFIFLMSYAIYGQNQKIKRSISTAVKSVYSCIENDEWNSFEFDKKIIEIYRISSIQAEIDGKTVYYNEYELNHDHPVHPHSQDMHIKGVTTYVWTLPEVESFVKDRVKNLEGYGKYNAVFTIKMPTGAFLRKPMDDMPRRISVIGMLAVLAGIIVSVSLLIISLSKSVRTMEKVMKGWDENDFKVELPPNCINELSTLVNTFNNAGQKIHENYAMRDRFIMGLSHDFKTPLALIHGYSELLQKDIPDLSKNEKAAKDLACIEANSDQIETMLSELLDFVSLEGGDIPFYFEETNLGSWLNALVLRAKNDASVYGRELSGSIGLRKDLMVRMDSRLFDRAMTNLLQNAIRYTGENGKILLSAKEAEGKVVISVQDDGPGIDKKDMPHVFDMFYRASHERDKKGMGIGLSVVKTVVTGHGWKVYAENIKPHGACFSIEIPVE